VLLGSQALIRLESILDAPDGEVVLDARAVKRADAFAAVVLRAGIERQLDRDPMNSITIRAPSDPSAWDWLADLLSGPPSRCTVTDQPRPASRQSHVLIPAQRVRDDGDRELLVYAARYALPSAHIRVRPTRLLLEGLGEAMHNALTHGADSDVDAMVAVVLEPQSNNLQGVVLDLGRGVCDDEDPVGALRAAVAKSKGALGGLSTLMRRETPATVRLAAGRGRVRWTKDETRVRDVETRFGGFAASLEVHLEG
jgi:hypothetical protein